MGVWEDGSTIDDHSQRHAGLGSGPVATTDDAFEAYRKRRSGKYGEQIAINKSHMFSNA